MIFLKFIINFLINLVLIVNIIREINGKYVEGHVKTLEDWVFLARFCFLSGRGRYEYHIEFDRRYGEPQLLLYYDEKTQWPAVYKTGKTCSQKIAVLNPIDNQIVTLSARSPYSFQSGCTLHVTPKDNDPKKNKSSSFFPKEALDETEDENSTYYDQFLMSSTTASSGIFGNQNFTTYNLSDIMNYEAEGIFNETNFEKNLIPLDIDTNNFENGIENNTKYLDYVEELFNDDDNTTKIRLKRASSFGKETDQDRQKFIVTCNSAGGFLTARERWWYIAISNCGNKNGIDVKFRFRMTNGPPGDFWHEHFSADEMYIPPILLAQSLIYTFLLLAVFVCAVELKTRHLYHCTYRLFTFSVFLQYFGILFLGVAWARYAIHGLGPYTTLGTIFQGASEIVFLMLLLLMAKGYTITRARLSTWSTIKLTIFVNIYIVFYISLFIYREEVFDPGEVLNLYESAAGYGLAGLRCISWGAFLVSTANTLRKNPEKANFFYPFGALGSVWILGGPFLTFTGIVFFDPWVRESVLYAVFAICAIGGHTSFLYLTWPSRANKSFPYHVRTNHVGVMSAEDDGADYPRHMYEPSIENNASSGTIPLSRAEEVANVYNQYLQERNYYNEVSTPFSHVSFPPGKDRNSKQLEQQQQQQNEEEHKSDDNQADSGHPSIDDDEQSMETPEIGQNMNKSSNNSNTKKMQRNPFVINELRMPPNKIILEPINPPIAQNINKQDVPKHLFAAKATQHT